MVSMQRNSMTYNAFPCVSYVSPRRLHNLLLTLTLLRLHETLLYGRHVHAKLPHIAYAESATIESGSDDRSRSPMFLNDKLRRELGISRREVRKQDIARVHPENVLLEYQ